MNRTMINPAILLLLACSVEVFGQSISCTSSEYGSLCSDGTTYYGTSCSGSGNDIRCSSYSGDEFRSHREDPAMNASIDAARLHMDKLEAEVHLETCSDGSMPISRCNDILDKMSAASYAIRNKKFSIIP